MASNQFIVKNGLVINSNNTNPYSLYVTGSSASGSVNLQDIFLISGSSFILGSGNGTTPSSFTLRGRAASGSSVSGADIFMDASNGTGVAGSGKWRFRTAPANAGSNITVDNTGPAINPGEASSTTHILNSPAGNNRIVIFTSGFWGYLATGITGITYNGVAMTKLVNGAGGKCTVWYILEANLPASTGTYTVAFSGANPNDPLITSFINVNQSNPFGTVVATTTSSGTSLSATHTVSTLTQIVFSVFYNYHAVLTGVTDNAGQTSLGSLNYLENVNTSTTPGIAGNLTVRYTWSSGTVDAGIITFPINPLSNTTANTMVDALTITNNGTTGIGYVNPAGSAYSLNVNGRLIVGTNTDNGYQAYINGNSYFNGNQLISGSNTITGSLSLVGTSGLTLSYINSGSKPSTTATPVFTTYYGGNTNALGDPTKWIIVSISGSDYKIPAYS